MSIGITFQLSFTLVYFFIYTIQFFKGYLLYVQINNI